MNNEVKKFRFIDKQKINSLTNSQQPTAIKSKAVEILQKRNT